jgi:hypothetical protein
MKHPSRFVPVDLAALPWTRHMTPSGEPAGMEYRTGLPGGGGLPQVHMTHYEPHWVEPRHRHPEDEVLVLIEGQLTLEGATYRAPSALFVGRGTLYGPLEAGPEGAVFVRVAYSEAMIAVEPAVAVG